MPEKAGPNGGIMAADDTTWRGRWKRWRDCIAQCWQRCLDLALVLWIVRVPLCAVAIGWLILDYTPQAQDLFTEFADSYVRIAVFLVLLTVVWAGTTHYAARLLLDTDMRFRAYADPRVWTYLVGRKVGPSRARSHSFRRGPDRIGTVDLQPAPYRRRRRDFGHQILTVHFRCLLLRSRARRSFFTL